MEHLPQWILPPPPTMVIGDWSSKISIKILLRFLVSYHLATLLFSCQAASTHTKRVLSSLFSTKIEKSFHSNKWLSCFGIKNFLPHIPPSFPALSSSLEVHTKVVSVWRGSSSKKKNLYKIFYSCEWRIAIQVVTLQMERNICNLYKEILWGLHSNRWINLWGWRRTWQTSVCYPLRMWTTDGGQFVINETTSHK